jgi:Holliday junction resolvase RusA-like endonuclease
MGRSVRIELPGVPPSQNEFAGRQNPEAYRKEKSTWTDAVMWKAKVFHLPKPFEKADVTLEYYFPDNRRRDPDNYCGKLLLDGLTRGGIIVDDSFDHINLRIAKGGVDPKRPRTTITVKEI